MVRVARERRAQRKGLELLDAQLAGVALVLADVVRGTGSHRACWPPRACVAFALTRFFRHRRSPLGATASARQRAQPNVLFQPTTTPSQSVLPVPVSMHPQSRSVCLPSRSLSPKGVQCYRWSRSEVLPMIPVAQGRVQAAGRATRSRAAPWGAPSGGRVLFEAGPCITSAVREFQSTGRAPGGLGRGPWPTRSPPGAPCPRAGRRLRGHGGMGCPPWGFLAWGAPRKGGFQGGKPRRGASGTSLCSVPADFSVSSREGGGRGAAQGAGNSPPASCSATARVALLLALKRRAKRRGALKRRPSPMSQASRHRGAGRSLPTGPTACSTLSCC